MKIDVSKVIFDFDGKPLQVQNRKHDTEGKTKEVLEDMTVRFVLENAALSESQQKPCPASEKLDRMILARRIHRAKKEVAFSAEEVAKLKSLVLDIYPPLTAGLVAEILDGKEEESADAEGIEPSGQEC